MLARRNCFRKDLPFATSHEENWSSAFEITFILQISLWKKIKYFSISHLVNRIIVPFGMCACPLGQSCPISVWSSARWHQLISQYLHLRVVHGKGTISSPGIPAAPQSGQTPWPKGTQLSILHEPFRSTEENTSKKNIYQKIEIQSSRKLPVDLSTVAAQLNFPGASGRELFILIIGTRCTQF